jgi:hypothetical protein
MDGPWKLITTDGKGTWELYRLDSDLGEKTDLASQQPERVARMSAALQRRIESFARSAKGEDYRP